VKLVLAHFKADMLELLRYPAFSVPTLVFPTLFFSFFVVPGAIDADPNALMAFYAAFAVLGVAFFQFGVSIANDRISAWNLYLRTLPIGPGTRFPARVLSALQLSLASAGLVVVVALIATPAALAPGRWVELAAVILVGSIPFALLGIAIGYWLRPKGALPVANVLYLFLAFAGGLWTGPADLPDAIAAISPYLPTRQWADLLFGAVTAAPSPPRAWLALTLYTVVFFLLAARGYRRDEGERFR